MPAKKPRKRKPASGTRRKQESPLEERLRHFEEELEGLGGRFEKKGEEWDSWFHRTFGVIGPLISSIFALLIIALVVWLLDIVKLNTGLSIFSSISAFLIVNMGWFLLIFLFFSYASYFSRSSPRAYVAFSPVVTAAGITIALWLAGNAMTMANLYLGVAELSAVSLFIQKSMVWIFGFFVLMGYLFLLIKISFEKPSVRREARPVMRKSAGDAGIRMLYRSGKDRILGGVCGGIAEYLGVDPVLIRLLWVIFTLALWGLGILVYIISWIIIPRNPNHKW